MKENRPYIEGGDGCNRKSSEYEVTGKLFTVCKGNLRREVHCMRYFFKTLYSNQIIANCSVKKSEIFRKILYFMFSGYCDGLRAGGQRFDSWKGQENFSLYHSVQNASGVHPASYPIGSGAYFPGDKAAVE
jgi:hypothetical protein